MHTLKVMAAGIVLLLGCLLVGRILAAASPPPERMLAHAARAFLVIWFVWSGANTYIGVTRAGYTVKEEFPIFLLVYGVPAATAGYLIWRFTRGQG
jgi:hypothetical protein